MRFDEQIDEKEFAAFLSVNAKEITSVIKIKRFLKGPRHVFGVLKIQIIFTNI